MSLSGKNNFPTEVDPHDFGPLGRPLIPFTLSVLIGIIFNYHFDISVSTWFWVLILSLAGLFSTIIWKPNRRTFLVISVLILAFSIGGLRFTLEDQNRATAQSLMRKFSSSQTSTLQGKIMKISPPQGKSKYGTIEIGEVEVTKQNKHYLFPVDVIVRNKFELPPHVQLGDTLRVTGFLQSIKPNSVPGSFNPREYSMIKGLGAVVWVKEEDKLFVIKNPKPALMDRFRQGRNWLENRSNNIINNALPQPYSGLLSAIVLGQKNEMTDEMKQNMVYSGMLHLTAVSGIHVSLVLVVFMLIFKLLGLKRKYRFWVTIILVFIFIQITGAKPSAIRAGIMGGALILGWMLQRESSGMNSLALAVLLTTFYNPFFLFQIGFQLSYLIVWVMFLHAGAFKKIDLESYGPITHSLKYLGKGLTASILAFLGSFPLLWFYFHQFTPVNIIANLIAIPLITLALALSIVMLLVGVFWVGIAGILGPIIFFLVFLFSSFTEWCANLPFGHALNLTSPPLFFVVGWYLFMVWLGTPSKKLKFQVGKVQFNKFNSGLALVSILFLIALLFPSPNLLKIDFLASGQGDSTVVHFPGGGVMIIDGGGGKPEWPILVPYLRKEGIKKIDSILISHPEGDHIGEIPEVLKNFDVSMLWYNGEIKDTTPYKQLQEAIKSQKGLKVIKAEIGQELLGAKGIHLELLHPPAGLINKTQNNSNAASVVACLNYGNLTTLFTGDIGSTEEADLLRIYPHLDCDILKVAHHGSKFSSSEDFLNRVSPEVSVILVGNNSYGHPSKETMDRLYASGSLVFRTDRSGTVRISSNGESYTVRPLKLDYVFFGNPAPWNQKHEYPPFLQKL